MWSLTTRSTDNRGFGRRRADDPRDQLHLMRAVDDLPPADRTVRRRIGPILDQGDTSACVGYAGRAWMSAGPTMTPPAKGPTAWELYQGAQDHDEWPGREPEFEGSSARGLMKHLRAIGRVGRFVWATDVEAVASWIVHRGTVLLGCDWHQGMLAPGTDGLIRPTGASVGGHEVLLCGYNHERREFEGQNSWGEGWGARGRFRLRWADLAALLRAGGDAVGAIEVTPPARRRRRS